MLPEVERYIALKDKIKMVHEDLDTFRALSTEAERSSVAYRTQIAVYLTQIRALNAEAVAELTASTNPVAKWIGENVSSAYGNEMMEVLMALPTTLSVIDDLADAGTWCSSYDKFRAAAIISGVFPEYNAVSPDMRELVQLMISSAGIANAVDGMILLLTTLCLVNDNRDDHPSLAGLKNTIEYSRTR